MEVLNFEAPIALRLINEAGITTVIGTVTELALTLSEDAPIETTVTEQVDMYNMEVI